MREIAFAKIVLVNHAATHHSNYLNLMNQSLSITLRHGTAIIKLLHNNMYTTHFTVNIVSTRRHS